MKKLSLIAAAFSMLALVSCEKDEDGNPDVNESKGYITYDNQNLEISRAQKREFGTNLNRFAFGDGAYDVVTENASGSFSLATSLYAEGSTFVPGTYSLQSHDAGQGTEPYGYAVFVLDANNDNLLDGNDLELEAIGGTIEISGTGENQTAKFAIELENGKTITGECNGSITLLEE